MLNVGNRALLTGLGILQVLGAGCSRSDPAEGVISKFLSTDRCMDRLAMVANPDHAKSFMEREYQERASCVEAFKKIEAVGCSDIQDGASCRARYQPVDSTAWSHWVELKKHDGRLLVDWFSATGFNPDSYSTIFGGPAGKMFSVRVLASFPEGVDDMVKVRMVHPTDMSDLVDISVDAHDAVYAVLAKGEPPREVSMVLVTREDRPPVIFKIEAGWSGPKE